MCYMLTLLTWDNMQKNRTNVEVRNLPRRAQITQTNSAHEWRKINTRRPKSLLVILRSLQIRAKYNENLTNWLGTVNSGVRSVRYSWVCAKIRKIRIDDCWMLLGPLDQRYSDNCRTGYVIRQSNRRFFVTLKHPNHFMIIVYKYMYIISNRTFIISVTEIDGSKQHDLLLAICKQIIIR